MLFSKERLTGVYTWSTDPKTSIFQGEPSRRLFDRWNGDQVLFMINHVLQSIGDHSIAQGMRIERLIINKLSFDPCSELTVFAWLQKEMTVDAV